MVLCKRNRRLVGGILENDTLWKLSWPWISYIYSQNHKCFLKSVLPRLVISNCTHAQRVSWHPRLMIAKVYPITIWQWACFLRCDMCMRCKYASHLIVHPNFFLFEASVWHFFSTWKLTSLLTQIVYKRMRRGIKLGKWPDNSQDNTLNVLHSIVSAHVTSCYICFSHTSTHYIREFHGMANIWWGFSLPISIFILTRTDLVLPHK